MSPQRAVHSAGLLSVGIATGLLGVAAAITAWTVEGLRRYGETEVIVGPLIGPQLIALLALVGAVCLAAAGAFFVARARRTPRVRATGGATRAWTIVAAVGLFIAAVIVILCAALWGIRAVIGPIYTDLGTTRNGIHFFTEEEGMAHAAVTVYRQDGWMLDEVARFDVIPAQPFASHDYELYDNLDSVALVWHWRTDQHRRLSDSIVIPLQ